MSVIANDLNDDVYIGIGLPLNHNKDGLNLILKIFY